MRELLIVTALLAGALPARAQSTVEEARQRFERGLAAVDAGDLEGAEALFRESLELRRSGSAAFNLARVLERTDQPREAVELYREVAFLRGVPEDVVAQARARVQALEPRLAHVTIEAPPDMTLSGWIDDRSVELNADIPVDPGAHRVRVQRGARTWVDTQLRLREGERRTIDARVPPPSAALAGGDLDADRGGDDTWLWVTLTTLAVVLIGGGVALGVGLAVQPGCGTLEPGCIMAGAPSP